MNFLRWWYILTLVMCGPGALAETISHGRFEKLTLYRPQGEAKQLVLFFSGERGWTADLEPIAQSLSRQGALVAGIDTPAFFRNLESDGSDCVAPDGDLENLSHFLQAYYRSSTYRPAILAGHSAGAALVYAMLAQAPAGTFAGGISLGFCPSLALVKPLCQSGHLHTVAGESSKVELQPASRLGAPWLVMQGMNGAACHGPAKQFIAKVQDAELLVVPGDGYGEGDFHTWEPQFAAAFQRLAAQAPQLSGVSAAELKDLPLIEVAAKGDGDILAVLISGDGGWAGIDKELSAALSKHGMPVVGLDSLRYFWSERTPQSTAADVDRILRYYLAAWNKRSVLLIGYSQGADVMPFVVNRLPPATRERLSMVALLALSQTAVFEFHLQNWLGKQQGAVAVEPELLKMKGIRTLCVYGADEHDSLCGLMATKAAQARQLQIIKLSGGHHFDGNYANLAVLILARMR